GWGSGGAQSRNATSGKVVFAGHGRTVGRIIGDAFDIPGTVEPGVDRHGVATSPAARVSKGEGLVVVRSGETTARTCLAGARARDRVPANPILLCRITRHELAQRDLLIWTAGAGRDGERERLHSTRISEAEGERDRGAAAK